MRKHTVQYAMHGIEVDKRGWHKEGHPALEKFSFVEDKHEQA